MRKLIKVIKMDLFPWDILVGVGVNQKDVFDYLKNKVGYTLDAEELSHFKWDNTSKKGFTICVKSKAIIMLVRDDDPAIIAHEAFHAANFLLENAGLTLHESSDEAWAYAIEYIVRHASPPKKIKLKYVQPRRRAKQNP